MKTFYIPVHFYEREGTNDDLVMMITQRDIDDDEMRKRLCRIKLWLMEKQDEYPSRDDIVDEIFKELAYEIDGVWCYCQPLEPLVIGDPCDRNGITGRLKAIGIDALARMLVRLNPGENLYFYESYDEEEGYSGNVFCATMIKKYESYAIYINCHGGGLPFITDVTEYDQGLKKQKEALTEYFRYLSNFAGHVYVDSGLVEDDSSDE